MHIFFVFSLVFAAVAAHRLPLPHSQRIIGGSITDIESHPDMVALLNDFGSGNLIQSCAGVILNQRSILSAAHCSWYLGTFPSVWRVRVGSSYPYSGGFVYAVELIFWHPNYFGQKYDSDIMVMHTTSAITYSDIIQPALLAGLEYFPPDNSVVWATGWGYTTEDGPSSEELRHVQMWTVNQEECAKRYATVNFTINDNMICAGWLDVGGRDQCLGDNGGPLYHNGVVVGVTSLRWSNCDSSFLPGVNVRVSSFITWIQNTVYS